MSATRETSRSPLDVPFAVSIMRPDSTRPGQRHAAFDETLQLLPGVAVANRGNPSQDPRISIRGFGARSNFGVRGVRVLRDGVPLTLPDGQTPVDYMDLESVGTIEVLRGSASALYGNAGGGVIDVHSSPPPLDPIAVQARALAGANGLRRWVAAAGGTSGGDGALRYQGNVSRGEIDGYRQYSRQRTTQGFGRAMLRAGKTDLAFQAMLFDMPLAQNPGALTREQFEADPRQADRLSLQKRPRKAVRQGQYSLSATRALARGGELSALAYGGTRSLDNPLTGFIVDLQRASYGASLRGTVPTSLGAGVVNALSAGVDVQRQDDDRRNFQNCNDTLPVAVSPQCPTPGRERGALRLDQRELVTSVGPFVRDEVRFAERYRVSVGARADVVKFDVRDHFITATNPDDSGDRTLRAVSPAAGVVARLGQLQALYANVSTAFETPTTNELANKPDGSAGINPDLKPQYSTTGEVGLKGIVLGLLRYDVAGFVTGVRDELVPFEAAAATGRSYFRNAGRTSRRGAELGLEAQLAGLTLNAAYTYSNFRYVTYTVISTDAATSAVDTANFAGNRIPGVPTQLLQLSATYRLGGAYATLEQLASGSRFVNDANAGRAPGYGVTNVRVGGSAAFGRPWLSPVVGVQNVFDKNYAGSLSLNAVRNKYYEPATGRAVYVGLTVGAGR